MRLRVKRGGVEKIITAGSFEWTEKTRRKASWRAIAKDGDLTITVNGWTEFDGFKLRVDPLLGFVGAVPLWAQLLTSDRDATKAVVPALSKVVAAIRRRCPQARLTGPSTGVTSLHSSF